MKTKIDNQKGILSNMKPNNHWYKLIASLLDESIDSKHHTDLYYAKKIAESYDRTYTSLGNVNKYLREFADEIGILLDDKHHPSRYYLRIIAEELSDEPLEHNTENYYLRVILANLEEPTV